jgi:hypothetical protein
MCDPWLRKSKVMPAPGWRVWASMLTSTGLNLTSRTFAFVICVTQIIVFLQRFTEPLRRMMLDRRGRGKD